MNNKIKVVWLCHFSNAFVHEKLTLGDTWFMKIIRKIIHKPLTTEVSEFAVWVTNGIKEFEKIDEIELHIVSPYPHLRPTIQEFDVNGIHYHFFHNEDDSVIKQIYKKNFRNREPRYWKNRRVISKIIKTINPKIVHLIGAENPYYSMGIFDLPLNVITITQLQTLLNNPDFAQQEKNSISYLNRAKIERQILQRSDYIGTISLKLKNIIQRDIKPDVNFVRTCLPVFEPIVKEHTKKQFDFVYFASNISKAADLAIEAFGRAYQNNHNITLDIIGGYDAVYKQQLDTVLQNYGALQAVSFEGRLPSHEDVLRQIRKSRFALLPLRVDLTSCTVREAMSNGLPVITTDTGELGTQKLNQKRQSVLISPINDHQALANNMMLLLNDEELAETIQQNAYQTRSESESNEAIVRQYVKVYKACVDNQRNHTPLPAELTVL